MVLRDMGPLALLRSLVHRQRLGETGRFRLSLLISGFGGLEVVCWPLVPKFAGSHPAEAV